MANAIKPQPKNPPLPTALPESSGGGGPTPPIGRRVLSASPAPDDRPLWHIYRCPKHNVTFAATGVAATFELVCPVCMNAALDAVHTELAMFRARVEFHKQYKDLIGQRTKIETLSLAAALGNPSSSVGRVPSPGDPTTAQS